MAKLIIALLSVQAVVPVVLGLEFQGLEFNTVDEVVAFANDIGTKSSVEEQAVLKTLLNERGQWHPEATSLFKDVVKRPSSRRLATLGSRSECNGATETTCKLQVDNQCSTCNWDGSSCSKNDCSVYKSETTCCANAMKVATGCIYNKEGTDCVAKTCDNVGKLGTNPFQSVKDPAVRNAACTKQPGCTSVCESENAAQYAKADGKESEHGSRGQREGYCMEGSDGDYTCTAKTPTTIDSFSIMTEAKKVKADMNADQAMGGLMAAMGVSSCNLMDCASCMKMSDCAEMKKEAGAGGKCNAKCKALAQSDAEVECLFCGQKAAGCTPAQATPFASCSTVALTDVVKAAASLKCDAACAAAKATCPSTDGAEMSCMDTAVAAGAAGLTPAMVGLLAPVFACLLVANLMM